MLHTDLVDFLSPYFRQPHDRSSLVLEAFTGTRLPDQIEFSGAARDFTIHLLDRLQLYGSYEREQHAITRLLICIDKEAGVDRQEIIQHFIRRIESGELEPQNYQKNLSSIEKLTRETKFWLEAYGYRIHQDNESEDETDIIAETLEDFNNRRILIRCVRGEVQLSHLQALQSTAKGHDFSEVWLVAERRISTSAQNHKSHIRLFKLTEIINVIWGRYFDYLKSYYREHYIEEYYVDLKFRKPVFELIEGERRVKDEKKWDKYSSLENYVDEWLREESSHIHLSILGDMGVGKSWFAQRLAYRQMMKYMENPYSERLPIFVALRDFSRSEDVAQVITNVLNNKYEVKLSRSKIYETFQNLNRSGKLLLILDGFDEMSTQMSEETITKNFWELAKLAVPNSKVVLTGRSNLFKLNLDARYVLEGKKGKPKTIDIHEKPEFDIIYLLPFDKQQIELALQRRLGKNEAAELFTKIEALSGLEQLAAHPVFLDVLPIIKDHLYEGITRFEVYRIYFEKIIHQNVHSERTHSSERDILLFMEELAWHMHRQNTLKVNFENIPQIISKHFRSNEHNTLENLDYDLRTQSFLTRSAEGEYAFAHKSFLEYFVACKLARIAGALPLLVTSIDADAYILKDLPLQETFGVKLNLEIIGFLTEIIQDESTLLKLLRQTRGKTFKNTRYIGTNALMILKEIRTNNKMADLTGLDLSDTVIQGLDLTFSDLTDTTFEGADIKDSKLWNIRFNGNEMSGGELEKFIKQSPQFLNAKLDNISYKPYYTQSRGGCFPHDTLVKMADHSFKPIGEVKIGDEILSYCNETGELSTSTVVGTYADESDEFFVINNVLVTTPSEPLFVDGRWVATDQITKGMQLKTLNGNVLVQSVERVFKNALIFNLMLSPHHVFFANDTLVHNGRSWFKGRF